MSRTPGVNKRRINCLGCGAAYALDLDKLPPGRKAMKCLNCGQAIPLLAESPAQAAAPAAREEAPPPLPPAGPRDTEGWEEEAGEYPLMPSDPLSQGEVQSGGWLALYGDTMSILLVFFVLLFAISNLDSAKFQAVMGAVSQSLGGQVRYIPVPVDSADPVEELVKKVEREHRAFRELEEHLTGLVRSSDLQARVLIKDEKEGLALIAQDVSMFDLGSADIKEDIKPFLLKVAHLLEDVNNQVVVEGHTDDLPINNPRFPSNWELSTARATNVLRFLLEHAKLNPDRLSAAGYAFYRPRQPSGSPEADKNRRIEILIKKVYDTEVLRDITQRARQN